jgi:hypothetical protein
MFDSGPVVLLQPVMSLGGSHTINGTADSFFNGTMDQVSLFDCS